MSANLQTVQRIYEAFGSGDIPAVLEHLAPDVAWEQWDDNHAQEAGVLHMQVRRGREGAAEFFGIVGGFDIHEFQVLGLMDGGDRVGAEIRISLTTPQGVRVADEELHLWTFGPDGLVTRVRHYVDTAKHIAATSS